MFTSDPAMQRARFARELSEVVRTIRSLDKFEPAVRALGVRHRSYGVEWATPGDGRRAPRRPGRRARPGLDRRGRRGVGAGLQPHRGDDAVGGHGPSSEVLTSRSASAAGSSRRPARRASSTRSAGGCRRCGRTGTAARRSPCWTRPARRRGDVPLARGQGTTTTGAVRPGVRAPSHWRASVEARTPVAAAARRSPPRW